MQIDLIDAKKRSCEWENVISQFPKKLQDIYFQPAWAKLHELGPNQKAFLFVYKKAGRIWVYPFLLQSISNIGSYPVSENWFDIKSPYGYGGPISNTENHDFLTNAQDAFFDWCKKKIIVAEFVRFHPLIENIKWASPNMIIENNRETVSLKLNNLKNGNLPFDDDAKYMVRRAQKDSIKIVNLDVTKYFNKFKSLYINTMDRVNADDYYYFSKEYFLLLKDLVKNKGWLIGAKKDEEFIAISVFLRGEVWMHYHLSGSTKNESVPGMNNLLLLEAAKFGWNNGLERMHLGGGISQSPDDSLLKFKKSMSTCSHRFFIGKKVHNREIYRFLCNKWREEFPSLSEKYNEILLRYRKVN